MPGKAKAAAKETPPDKVKKAPPPAETIPLPPGFVPDPKDFTAGEGEEICTAATGRVVKSLVWGSTMAAAMPCLSLFFMGRAMMFFLSSSIQLVGIGAGILSTAFIVNHRLSANDRVTLIAVGLGLLVFVLWRAQAGGILTRVVEVEPERPPVFFDIQE
jgi:hypothetical protein